MVVTGITETSHERYTVVFDDGTELRTTLSALTSLRLFQGKDLDEEELSEFRKLSARSLTLERAIQLISYRPLSCRELKDKLISKGVDPETAEYCPQRLTEMGLMDDARYASSLVRHYTARGYGAGRISAELYRHGISGELRENALEEIPDQKDDIDRLLSAKIKDPADSSQIRKATAFLYRRGFSWDEIREALRRMEQGIEFEEEY